MTHAVLTGTGQRAEVSSTTTRRPSSSGSMKRISSESFQCRMVPTSEQFSGDWLQLLQRLRKLPGSLTITSSVTSPHALQTSARPSEPRFTSLYPTLDRGSRSLKQLLTATKSRFAAFTASIRSQLTTFMTSRTRGDLVCPRSSLFKTCITVSKQ